MGEQALPGEEARTYKQKKGEANKHPPLKRGSPPAHSSLESPSGEEDSGGGGERVKEQQRQQRKLPKGRAVPKLSETAGEVRRRKVVALLKLVTTAV